MKKKIPAALALGAAAALALSACGGGGTSSATDTTPAASTGGGAGLHVASTSLGKVLVDGSGRTVYMLTTDGRDHSTCSSSCLQLWPAVTPGSHAGVTAPVGSTVTQSGSKTATVAGHPVYTFSGDQAAGDVNGEGLTDFGGTWYALSPSGAAITSAGAQSSSSSSSAPYRGSGY
jgi:predicted lipoprotein with Yx(FWY)xxD motif